MSDSRRVPTSGDVPTLFRPISGEVGTEFANDSKHLGKCSDRSDLFPRVRARRAGSARVGAPAESTANDMCPGKRSERSERSEQICKCSESHKNSVPTLFRPHGEGRNNCGCARPSSRGVTAPTPEGLAAPAEVFTCAAMETTTMDGYARDTRDLRDLRDAREGTCEPLQCPESLRTANGSHGNLDGLSGGSGAPDSTSTPDTPAPHLCACGSPAVRRDHCWSCYKKLGEAGLPIGADRRAPANAARGVRQAAARLCGASQDRLDDLARRLPADARGRIELALQRARGAR